MAERLREDYSWTPRQREVLDLVACGRSNTEIAEALGISLSGAKWHVSEILSKLNSDSREEAAEYWRRYNGLAPRFARIFRGLSVSSGVRWGAGVAGVAVAAAALVGVLLVSAGDDDNELTAAGDGSPTATGTPTTEATATTPPKAVGTPASPGDFTVRRGDQLLVCVAAHPDLGTAEEFAMASALLAQIEAQERDNPLWQSSAIGGKPGVVAAGCPGGYRAPPDDIGRSVKETVPGARENEPSAFPVHFFVLPDSMAHLLGSRLYGRAALEMACEGHNCGEVTTAIYAPAASFRDPAVLRSILTGAIPLTDGLPSSDEYPLGHPE